MGSPIQIGLSTGVAQLLSALGRVCEVEGVVALDLHSIQFLEDEVEVLIVRPDGSRRHNIYPLAVLCEAPIGKLEIPMAVADKSTPNDENTKH